MRKPKKKPEQKIRGGGAHTSAQITRFIGRSAKWRQHGLSALFHVESGGSTYFLTFALKKGIKLDKAERAVVLESVLWGHPEYWILHGACIMPDHVHMLLTPVELKLCASEGTCTPNTGTPNACAPNQTKWMSVGEIVKGIKSVTARRINKLRAQSGSLWESDYYERSVRNDEDFQVKLEYLALNPVKRGLVDDGLDWDGLWIGHVC